MSSDDDFDIISDDSSSCAEESTEEEVEEEQEEEANDRYPNLEAADKIEEFLLGFLQQLADPDGGPIKLQVADRRKGGGAMRTVTFPAKRKTGSARQLTQMFSVLASMHEAVVSGVPTTKRDIYYKDVPLFKTQKTVDKLVDDLAATFELERADLNIRASAKGLIAGSGIVIHLVSGEKIQGNDSEGALIPVGEDIVDLTVDDDVLYILVVEKDAVFQTLCRLRFTLHALVGRGIIITGKGYPDLATRQLVALLASVLSRRVVIVALVDGDPHGLDILSVYKYGSRSMAHEGEKLEAARIKYLGVFASELESYGVDRDALIPITKKDEKKARALLRRPIPAKWKKELSHMLHLRRKAEIEILASVESTSDEVPGHDDCPLVRYLVTKIGYYVEQAKAKK